MTKIKQKLSLFLVIALVAALCATVLTGCKIGGEKGSEKGSETATEAPTGDGGDDIGGDNNDGKIQYTVSVKTEGGMMLKGVTVEVYDGDEKVGGGITDENGSVSIALPKKDGYIASAALLPDGYTSSGRVQFLGTNATLSASSEVIKDGVKSDTYQLGDVMHDFTFTTYDGKEVTLSEVLEEKDMLLLNFWYDGCSWCKTEMPEMNEVYNLYKDKGEILALSPSDDDDDIANYIKEFENGLDFPVASDMGGSKVIGKFAVSGYPTSIVIDKYGVICLMVTGYTSYDGFEAIFKWFTGDNYTQQLIEDPSILTPRPKPTDEGYGYEMPSSDEINSVISSGYKFNYYADDSEYAWPYLIGEKNGQSCIMTSNEKLNSSFSTLYVDIELKAGQAIAVEYWASCESGSDIFYILVDGQIIQEISGASEDWETCYPYVALKDGTHKLSLHYLKDSSGHEGEDRIYIKGIKILDNASQIDKETYIIRQASTDFKADGSGYENYVTVVLGDDGYYHVGNANGPLLLANMMTGSHFSELSVYETVSTNTSEFASYDGFYEKIVTYSVHGSNALVSGYCTVNEELRGMLETVADVMGIEDDNENQWLQMCVYYDAYGTNGVQMSDPIKGLTSFSAFDAVLGTNYVEYTRLLMPRGYYYKFVPTESGAYRVSSFSTPETLTDGETHATEGMICDENLENVHGNDEWFEKISPVDENNITVCAYMEAGKAYYINVWYYDIYATGTIEFTIERIGDTADLFTLASNSFFTFGLDDNGEADANQTIAGGADVMLVDGIYYVKNEDGSQGPALYADFNAVTGLFEETLLEAIDKGGFNFEKSNLDMDIEAFLESFEDSGTDIDEGFIDEWGEAVYLERMSIIEDVQNGIYHGFGDKTEQIKAFADMLISGSDAEELNGCIVVTEELAELLQMYMDTYTFEGVEHSWTKLCFFYKHYGPANNG